MHLHFATNFGFDNIYPKFVSEIQSASHGEIYRGQKGLLELLEEHLGLFDGDINDVIRVRQYQKAIDDALEMTPDLYIADSFKTDQWGSAKKLLQWRDELQLALWDFKCPDPKSQRLYTLAQIEGFTQKLHKGVNDRWKQIVERLKVIKKLPLSKITVYQPKELLPPFFTSLFDIIESKGIEVIWRSSDDSIIGATNLDTLKQRIAKGGKGKSALKDDNSIIIVEADNEKMAAHALSEYLIHKGSQPLLLIPDRGRILEQAIVSRGGSALGYADIEEDSSLDQLLSLVSLFIWQPINAERLIQFFSLPMAPLPKKLRNKLAEAYADKPGIGNDTWDAAIERYHSSGEKFESYNRQRAEELYGQWFGREKYNPKDGAPISDLIRLYTDLKNWALKLTTSEENEIKVNALQKLMSRCETLIELLEFDLSQGIKRLGMLMLNKYVDEVGTGTFARNHDAQLGAYEYVSHPSHVTAPVDLLVWWNFIDNGNPLSNHPAWTDDELKILSKAHVHESDKIIDLWYWELKQVILKTKEQLILVIPKSQLGEEVDPHLLMNDLMSTFENTQGLKAIVNIDEDSFVIDGATIPLEPNEKKYLPARAVEWNLGADFTFEPRGEESFSSLKKLFFYPAEYLLHYVLKIRSIDIPKIGISNLIKGKLAHDTAEKLWEDEKLLTYDDAKLEEIVHAAILDRIEREGTIFLLKKNKISYDEYVPMVTTGLVKLFKSIKVNGWKLHAVEEAYSYKDEQIAIGGRIDLVLERGGSLAVVDLKWGGRNSKMKELLSEEELQLVIYDKLLEDKKKKVYLNYYIISEGIFISRTNEAFVESLMIPIKNPTQHRKALWTKIVSTYKLRMEELKSGHIEVGDGMKLKDLEEQFDIWLENGDYLKPPPSSGSKGSKTKSSNFYSSYNNIIGS